MSNLNDFFIHSMVHPDVAAAYLEGKPVPPALLINEVPETSVAAVIADKITSFPVKLDDVIFFKAKMIQQDSEPTEPIDPEEPDGPILVKSTSPTSDTSEMIMICCRVTNILPEWIEVEIIDSVEYHDVDYFINLIEGSIKKKGKNDDRNNLPWTGYIRARDLNYSKDIIIYEYDPVFPIEHSKIIVPNTPDVLDTPDVPDEVYIDESYLTEVFTARLLRKPTLSPVTRDVIMEAGSEPVIPVSWNDPDLIIMHMPELAAEISEDYAIYIKVREYFTLGHLMNMDGVEPTDEMMEEFKQSISSGICMTWYLPDGMMDQFFDASGNLVEDPDILQDLLQNSVASIYTSGLKYKIVKLMWDDQNHSQILWESNESFIKAVIPDVVIENTQINSGILTGFFFISLIKFGIEIENAENIPEDIDICFQYQAGSDEWIDINPTYHLEPGMSEVGPAWGGDFEYDFQDENMYIGAIRVQVSFNDHTGEYISNLMTNNQNKV